ncbi:hypothetical protein ACRE_069250 [Hapsidospora chrysogenum ATCC 11550]|uniref:Uncharacterized protein n=1 Tax=Hapsidospora chrysogenum (strain ATCC 11550 / CBS 779.69 / DSM 880 / IAM 14645 / JCM 23072 / IMI 49137) TaxID=857340 RepID=A0A086SZ13_HAPC1|nr:hypothetical protein ACRE_069250 [Hapsidospora chrysogenum ATCC 11550]
MDSSTYGRDIALAFVGGFLAAVAILLAGGITVLRNSDAYGLGHWKLNAKMPLATMWMNLGYWTNADGERVQVFEEACSNLLREILSLAGLLGVEPTADDGTSSRSLAVLDVGFGCGDQTLELVRLTQPRGWSDFRYVGLTMNQDQVYSASRRIYSELAASYHLPAESFTLLCANAAVPRAWKPRVSQAVESLAKGGFTDRWFLALDCLYHFSPSRKPILEYAARILGANFMAFDLILNESASLRDTLTMRAVGMMMGCPMKTFLTEEQYREQLVECGYDAESIVIRDITEHVFPGVVKFLDDQERALSQYGISLGGYKLAGRLFDWFGRSKVVKASIVVARNKGSDKW